MNVYISRNGQQYGPYPVEKVKPMIASGNVSPNDEIWYEGSSNRMTVSAFFAAEGPPPLPSAATDTQQSPLSLSSAPPVLPLTGAATPLGITNDLEKEIIQGGRYVLFQYCISALVITFKRSSGITYLRPGESGAGTALAFSSISLVLGWWGIPWGPIWTISTIITNLRGGKDVTLAVLTQQLGPQRAAALLAQRGANAAPARFPAALRYALMAGAACVLLSAGLIGYGIYRVAQEPRTYHSSTPGRSEFDAANDLISANRGTITFGNNAEALAAAADFSKSMKQLRNDLFEKSAKKSFSISKNEFLTYCAVRDNQAIFLVHVPELRRFTSEAKSDLCQLAWLTARKALQTQGLAKDGMNLFVGVRGILLYERVMTGKLTTNKDDKDLGIDRDVNGESGKDLLYSAFARAETAEPAQAAPPPPSR
ncbi:MAG TPA: DUF4339 domain-containing protein [Verrucomicrobiae bacterium]